MNLIGLSWKNLTNKPWSMLLSVILFALGVGLISLLFLLEKQLQEKFEKNLAGIDLVIGAKGSPLQLILSSMYHIDAPTGNVSLEDARPFLNPDHPLIGQSVPLSMGDSYRGYRIVGTTHEFLSLYDAEVDQGKIWEANFDVTLGAQVANDLGLSLGDEFKSSHGFLDDEDLAHDHADAFKVVGILKPTGAVVDQLILCTTQSFWLVHDHQEEAPAEDHDGHEHGDEEGHDHEHVHNGETHSHEHDHAHDDHAEHDHSDEEAHDHDHDADSHDDHSGHDHDDHEHSDEAHAGQDHDDHNHDHEVHDHSQDVPGSLLDEDPEKQITSLLVKFKARNYMALNLQRNINENTDLQAATPAIEINRLFSMMDSGEKALRVLAFVIIFVSGLSVFISLYSSLRDRKYELALMRVSGASPAQLFLLIVIEGLLLALVGFALGILLSHGGMQVFAGELKAQYGYSFSGFEFLKEEWFLLLGALGIGLLAAIIPAIQASRTDIADTLTEGS